MVGFSGKVVEGEMRDRVDGFGISMKSHMVGTFRGWARSMQDLAAWMLRWSWAGANASRTVLGLGLQKRAQGWLICTYIYIILNFCYTIPDLACKLPGMVSRPIYRDMAISGTK